MFLRGLFFFVFIVFAGFRPAFAEEAAHDRHYAEGHAAASGFVVEAGYPILTKDKVFEGGFRLMRDGNPVTPVELREVDTKKIHMLVVDEKLNDYHHLYPEYNAKEGKFVYRFTPKADHGYKAWLDFAPVGEMQEMVSFTLEGAETCAKPCVRPEVRHKDEFSGVRVNVAFDKRSLIKGEPVHMMVAMYGMAASHFRGLEPVMGTYAHVVGFYDDYETVQHLHPQKEVPKDGRLGSSPLIFALTPSQSGFLKFFIHIRVKGEDIFLPMGVFVE